MIKERYRDSASDIDVPSAPYIFSWVIVELKVDDFKERMMTR